MGATSAFSNDSTFRFERLCVAFVELSPFLPIVDLNLYGVTMLSLVANLSFLSMRFCFSIVLLTSRAALTFDRVFISNHTEASRRHDHVPIILDLDN